MGSQESTNEVASQISYTKLAKRIVLFVLLVSLIVGVPLLVARFRSQKVSPHEVITDFPEFPFPENSEIKSSSSSQDDGGLHFNIGLETSMTLEEITEWYSRELEAQGWVLDEKASELKSRRERNMVLTKENMTLGIDLDEEEEATEVVLNLTISSNR